MNRQVQGITGKSDGPDIDSRSERIISYLEGDLSPGERESFEKELSSDSELRRELGQLSESWEMLGLLETKPHSPDLTRSTMEMVAVCAQQEMKSLKRRVVRDRLLLGLGLVLLSLAAVWAGVRLVSLCFPTPEQRRDRDQPLLARLDQLETAGDFAFLVQLKESGLFASPILHRGIGAGNMSDSSPNPDTRRGIETARPNTNDARQTTGIPRQAARFYHMSNEKQTALRNLHRRIVESPDAEAMLDVLDHYYNWYRYRLHETERDLIKTTPLASRMGRVATIHEQRTRKFQNNFRMKPPGPGIANDRIGTDPLKEASKDDGRFRGGRRMKALLPKELQNEDWSRLRSLYNEFCRLQSEAASGKTREPGNTSGHAHTKPEAIPRYQHDRGFRLVREFMAAHTPEELHKQLSPRGSAFMQTLPVKDQQRIFCFVLSFDHFWNEEGRGKNRGEGNMFAPDGESSRPRKDWERRPGQETNKSTRELAETLRRLPQESRDALLQLPADEMYARLLAIHWGFDSTRPGPPAIGREREKERAPAH